MEILAKVFLSILISFILCIIISPIIIKIVKKIKCNQPVYELVDMHTKKSGTPTFGGLIFLIGIIVTTLIVIKENNILTMIALFVMIAYGLIGFLDDFIKVKFKHNEGLKPYQKVLAQILIALIVSFYAFKSEFISGEILILFNSKTLNLGVFYIPLAIVFFLAITNSVNLTDGLDGLAGGVSLVYLIAFEIVFFILSQNLILGNDTILNIEYKNLMLLMGASIGSLLAYLMYNCHPATIFMGDTGSLALGGLLGAISLLTKMVLFVPIIGAMFVASSVSVIIQVCYYKLTKKRIFLMAPLHHHFEKKTIHETKIVTGYVIITAIMGILAILISLIMI